MTRNPLSGNGDQVDVMTASPPAKLCRELRAAAKPVRHSSVHIVNGELSDEMRELAKLIRDRKSPEQCAAIQGVTVKTIRKRARELRLNFRNGPRIRTHPHSYGPPAERELLSGSDFPQYRELMQIFGRRLKCASGQYLLDGKPITTQKLYDRANHIRRAAHLPEIHYPLIKRGEP